MGFQFELGSRGPAGADGTDATVPDPAAPSVWEDSFTVYLDRERCWFAGTSTYASPTLPLEIGVLPEQYWPAADLRVPVLVESNSAVTPVLVLGYLTVEDDGTVTLTTTVSVTGSVKVTLDSVSFRAVPFGD